MADSTTTATPSCALSCSLLAQIPGVDLGAVLGIRETGRFLWRAATTEIKATEEVFRIFDLDPALPLTLERMATRVHPDDLSLFYERIEQAQNAVSDLDFRPRLRNADGSVKYLHVCANRIRDQAGQLEYIGTVYEVTKHRRSEEALGEARARLTRMASLTTLGILAPAIAHEVIQPLSGIMTNLYTCLRTLETDPPRLDGARAAAQRAIRDVERTNALIARLRMLVATKEVTFGSLDLNDTIREALALLSSELQKHEVVLRTELAGDLPRVRGDRIQLQQVVFNLLANSSEAMRDVEDRPRHLLIRTELLDSANVCVSMRDEGVGFHPKDAQKLFDAFYTTKSDGMGMGLFISRTIVERHRGHLRAEPNEDHGATFSFYVPRE